ncbi:hypothetical protein PMAG_a3759 [Pseudoalteromonas mariniglutinosa NCIMB 1770]|nr:hypothetical protein [Pseudoalteromonas mariniglutinosa NCIMB 1770]
MQQNSEYQRVQSNNRKFIFIIVKYQCFNLLNLFCLLLFSALILQPITLLTCYKVNLT